jgi:uncharacterized protein (TIGR02679 family)
VNDVCRATYLCRPWPAVPARRAGQAALANGRSGGRVVTDAAVRPAGQGEPAGDIKRLQRLLGPPEVSWLVDRIRVRLERGEPVDGTITLVGASTAQRKAAARLLGRSVGRATSLSIPLPEVEAVLRKAGAAASLHAAVVALTGPVRHLAAERATEMQHWQQALAAARSSRLASLSWYAAWLEEIVRDGTVTRLIRQGHGSVLTQAPAVLERLPGGPDPAGMLLARLAESATGDARALDPGPLAGLVLRALARREGLPEPSGRQAECALWTAAGVVTDDLASQVLVLNVRAGGEPLGRWLTEAADAAEPYRVTLHQLNVMRVLPWAIDLYVCEHTAVLSAAADRLGPSGPALVCTEGEPSVACRRLLHTAVATGTRVHWHSDFSWAGLRRTAVAIRQLRAEPWLMSAGDYQAALAAGSADPLKGWPAASPWDTRLAELMQASGRAVSEERLLPQLLAGLAAGAR